VKCRVQSGGFFAKLKLQKKAIVGKCRAKIYARLYEMGEQNIQ
jgi:hypothetical protein